MDHCDPDRTAKIRELNDELRRSLNGGRVLMSVGVAELGDEKVRRVLDAVSRFESFDSDNDPHGEHDCAILPVEGHSILWKIDYFDLDLEMHSADAADPSVTVRILTVMLADEY